MVFSTVPPGPWKRDGPMGPGPFSSSSMSPTLCTLVLLIGLAGKGFFSFLPKSHSLESLKIIHVIASWNRLFGINLSGWNQRPEEDAGPVMSWYMRFSPAVAVLSTSCLLPVWKLFYETLTA